MAQQSGVSHKATESTATNQPMVNSWPPDIYYGRPRCSPGNVRLHGQKRHIGYMPKYIVEVNEQYSLAAIHARESLSHLVGPLESLRGVVLVTQPAYNSLEVYLDAEQYQHLEARQALKAQLRALLATEPEWVG